MMETWLAICPGCGDDVHWASLALVGDAWRGERLCGACRLDADIAAGRQSTQMRDRSTHF